MSDEAGPIHHLDMLVGELSRAWSELEEGLVLALGHVARLPSNDVTDSILRKLPVSDRIELIKIAISAVEHDPLWAAEVASLLEYVRGTLRARRNAVIHGRFFDAASNTSYILRDMKPRFRKTVQSGRYQPYRDSEIGPTSLMQTTDALRLELEHLAHLVLWKGGQAELEALIETRPQRRLLAHVDESLLRDGSNDQAD